MKVNLSGQSAPEAIVFPEITGQDSVTTRFLAIASHLPNHPAVMDETGVLTFDALNRASERLAAWLLQTFGTAPQPVLLYLPNTHLSAVGMLGVLKAGKFYVNVDPTQGTDFLRQIAYATQSPCAITTRALQPRAQAALGPEIPLTVIDDIPARMGATTPTLSSHSLAAIYYTSGSTGQPKGVITDHAMLLYRGWQFYWEEHMRPSDRILNLFSSAFALAGTIFWGALLNGATLCYRPFGEGDLSGLFDWLADHAVTAVYLTPSLAGSLAEYGQSHRVPESVRWIALGGQHVSPKIVIAVQSKFPSDAMLLNRIGSSEAALVARHVIQDADLEAQIESIPVGKAPAGVELAIIDEAGLPVPTGQTGQITIRSRFLSLGYWQDPDLTAAKFLPDPDGGDRRIFLTGDRGRMDADGLLYHLGRMDFMVKVRGYRVEPESIERALLTHPNLHECVVVARPSRNGDNRLIAYLVAQEQPAPAVPELRTLLAQTLPPYMIPARFVLLDRLPRNANTKVDRNALPLPDKARPDLDTPFVAPRSELEQQIAAIWAELLDLDEVGVEDNFFELGGDSLMALRMALLIEQRFQQQLPADYFRVATSSALAMTLQGMNVTRVLHDDSAKTPAQRDSTKTLARLDAPLAQLPRRSPPKVPINGALRRAAVELALRLPYHQGLRWLIWWSRQAFVRNTLYGAQQRQFNQLLMDVGYPHASAQRSFQANLFGNILQVGLRRWRMQDAAIGPDLFSEMVTARYRFWRTLGEQLKRSPGAKQDDLIVYSGLQHFQDAHAQGRGIILLTYHIPAGVIFTSMFSEWLNLAPILTLSQASTAGWFRKKPARLSEMPESRSPKRSTRIGMQGLYQLRAGGIVQIVNDLGYDQTNVLPQSIIGRRYHVKPGFAELAMATDAIVLPVYHLYEADGRMRTVFLSPIEPPDKAKDRDTQLREWVGKYALSLEMAWRAAPESLHWAALRHHVTQPMILETRRDDQ